MDAFTGYRVPGRWAILLSLPWAQNSGCGPTRVDLTDNGDPMKKGYKALLEEANREIRTLPARDALARHGSEDLVFVDLRDPRELAREGTIPGAFHCPRGMLEFWVDPESPYFKPVFGSGKQLVFFCQSGWRSALATKTVQDMGLPGVSHIEGGFNGWKAAGGPVAEVRKDA
jgi:rhodanese-related sulfurtransferase